MAHRRYLGTPERLKLRELLRARFGRDPKPSAAIVDSQSVRTTGVGGTLSAASTPPREWKAGSDT